MNLDQQLGDVINMLESALDDVRPLRCDPKLICEHGDIYRKVAEADRKIAMSIGWLTSLQGLTPRKELKHGLRR